MNEKVSFYSRCTVTADGRWFDNGGMPIEVPTKLEPEKVKTAEEIEEEKEEEMEMSIMWAIATVGEDGGTTV